MYVHDLLSMVETSSTPSDVMRTLPGICEESSLKTFLSLLAELRVPDYRSPQEMENIKLTFSASVHVSGWEPPGTHSSFKRVDKDPSGALRVKRLRKVCIRRAKVV